MPNVDDVELPPYSFTVCNSSHPSSSEYNGRSQIQVQVLPTGPFHQKAYPIQSRLVLYHHLSSICTCIYLTFIMRTSRCFSWSTSYPRHHRNLRPRSLRPPDLFRHALSLRRSPVLQFQCPLMHRNSSPLHLYLILTPCQPLTNELVGILRTKWFQITQMQPHALRRLSPPEDTRVLTLRNH
jgi:hypothetical protein